MLDSSVLEEEWKGLNSLHVGVIFLGEKSSAGILGRSRSVKECKNPGDCTQLGSAGSLGVSHGDGG